jgi:hypothetical protein
VPPNTHQHHIKHQHLKFKICVSGAAETGHCGLDAHAKAKELGRQVARADCVLVTGATTGFPLWTAMGAKEEGGVVVGLSPASTEAEHAQVYKLPLDYADLIVYTGFGYSGRNLLLTRSSDAVIIGCGRVGTVNEFTIAFEDGKPIGILEGEWETDEVVKMIIDKGHRPNDKVIFDSDPARLVERLIEKINQDKIREQRVYQNYDGVGGQGINKIL